MYFMLLTIKFGLDLPYLCKIYIYNHILNFLLLNINIYILNSDRQSTNYEFTIPNNVIQNEDFVNNLAIIQVIS